MEEAIELRGRVPVPGPRPLYTVASIAGIAAGLLVLLLAFSPWRSGSLTGAVLGGIFIVAGTFNIVMMTLPSMRMLRIDHGGVTWYSPLSLWTRTGLASMSRTLPWSEIVDIRLTTGPLPEPLRERVLIIPRSANSLITHRHSMIMRAAVPRIISRYGGIFAPPTDMPPAELLQTLQEWRANVQSRDSK